MSIIVKAVILAGGFGTRISEESMLKPKPMIEIGGMPILWHIMKYYSFFNINEFVICLGYRGYMIKEFFTNYYVHNSDVTIDLQKNEMSIINSKTEPWKVTLVDTGINTMTGGRLKKVKNFLDDETFCFTYGDGLSDLNIKDTVEFHKNNKKYATITAVKPPGRFGSLKIDGGLVEKFNEKLDGDGNWINGGFFVLEPTVFDYIKDDSTIWEREPLEKMTQEKQISAYKHIGFWHPLDTLRDKNNLEVLWNNNPPWKKW